MNSERSFMQDGIATPLNGVRVFVAEDEPVLLMVLTDALEEFGCTLVGSASHVSQALEFVERNAFDVAVLDGQLCDGAIDPVVDILVARGTPIVLASGISSAQISVRYSATIALQKPYVDDDLQRALLAALTQRK